MCKDLVPRLHMCVDLVPLLKMCENSVSILHVVGFGNDSLDIYVKIWY